MKLVMPIQDLLHTQMLVLSSGGCQNHCSKGI